MMEESQIYEGTELVANGSGRRKVELPSEEILYSKFTESELQFIDRSRQEQALEEAKFFENISNQEYHETEQYSSDGTFQWDSTSNNISPLWSDDSVELFSKLFSSQGQRVIHPEVELSNPHFIPPELDSSWESISGNKSLTSKHNNRVIRPNAPGSYGITHYDADESESVEIGCTLIQPEIYGEPSRTNNLLSRFFVKIRTQFQ